MCFSLHKILKRTTYLYANHFQKYDMFAMITVRLYMVYGCTKIQTCHFCLCVYTHMPKLNLGTGFNQQCNLCVLFVYVVLLTTHVFEISDMGRCLCLLPNAICNFELCGMARADKRSYTHDLCLVSQLLVFS
jgi:hypothetical protein